MHATDEDEGHPESTAEEQEVIMIPHPSTFVASAEEHRQDLLAFAARERLAATVADQTPRAPVRPRLWKLVTHGLRMRRSWLSLQLRPRVWTHA